MLRGKAFDACGGCSTWTEPWFGWLFDFDDFTECRVECGVLSIDLSILFEFFGRHWIVFQVELNCPSLSERQSHHKGFERVYTPEALGLKSQNIAKNGVDGPKEAERLQSLGRSPLEGPLHHQKLKMRIYLHTFLTCWSIRYRCDFTFLVLPISRRLWMQPIFQMIIRLYPNLALNSEATLHPICHEVPAT